MMDAVIRYLRRLRKQAEQAGELPGYMDSNRAQDLAQLIEFVDEIERELARETPDTGRLMLLCVNVGQLSSDSDWRQSAQELTTGYLVRRGGKKGAELSHGPDVSRNARYSEWQAKYEELYRLTPDAGHITLTDQVGEHFGVRGSTVREHVPNPKPTKAGRPRRRQK